LHRVRIKHTLQGFIRLFHPVQPPSLQSILGGDERTGTQHRHQDRHGYHGLS
jgi:hypothetical protein